MKLVVILFVITFVNAVPQFQQQEYNSNDQLNPLNDEEAEQEAKEQKKRTLLGPTFIGSTRHVGVHPLGFKYLLGYGPVGYHPYAKPVTVLKPVMHTHGWKPIMHIPVSKPVFKPIVPIVPVKPVHHYPPHVHVHPVHPVRPVQPAQPVQPVHPVHPEPVHPVQPVIPIQKPIAPPTFVKPLVPFQPQLPYFYPFFKPLSFQPQVYQPALQIQPPVISPVVHQPVVQQPPVFAPQFPQFFPRFVNQFPVPLPGVANPVGPIEHTNSLHTSYSATFPKHPIIGVHTPPPAVPFSPSPHFVHPAAQPSFVQQVHPVAQPPFIQQVHPVAQPHFVQQQPPVEQHLPGPPNVFPVPIQPHLLHVIRHFPHLFKHITPLYPVNNPAETPVAELPKPIVPPATIHNPFNPQDTGSSVQIPEHLPEHPNYRPDIQNYYPIQPDQGVHNVPDYQEQDNFFTHHQTQPNQPAPQTPLYLPPHPFLRQRGNVQEPINSVQTEFSATYPRNARIQLPSISLEPPYRRSDDRMK